MPTEKQERPRTYLGKGESYLRLEAYREKIVMGMSDDEVSTASGVAKRTVKQWRLENRIRKPKGFAAKQVEDTYAVSQFGESLGDVKHRTRASVVGGAWEPPVFVTREHLDYSLFLRTLDAAKRVLGMSNADITRALGVSMGSVEQGLEIYDRILRRSNAYCASCKTKLNPELNSNFCSTICEGASR